MLHSSEDVALGNQFVFSIVVKMLNLVISLCSIAFKMLNLVICLCSIVVKMMNLVIN